MTVGWAGPSWGEPSSASQAPVPLRSPVTAADAAYRAEGGYSQGFLVMAASVAGVGHRLALRRSDDSFGWAVAGPGKLLVVVADGVSGAAHGGHGAELAVRAACNHAASWPVAGAHGPSGAPRPAEEQTCAGGGGEQSAGKSGTEQSGTEQSGTEQSGSEHLTDGMDLCLGALMDANAVLVATAQEMGLSGRDLATTLVVAVIERDGPGAEVNLARVGDSAAFVLDGHEWQEVGDGTGLEDATSLAAGTEVDGQHDMATTATSALPGPTPEEVEDVAVGNFYLSPGQALVLMTDGLADPLRDGPSTVAPSLASVLAEAPGGGLSPLGLATVADFSRRGCQDDRALLAAWVVPEEPS
jgi:serine/threonine protein phosphatase PrpC